jgi:alpha-amylase/alpha-mannosidase (GH57 family)
MSQPTTDTTRYLCIHGHFYQPPRENPWLEAVETQDSAAPYHDWNERITVECYARNGASRIQNDRNEIAHILNNYARISFNFGPTLLSWMQEKAPRAYRSILEADKQSQARFSGHGSAIAQVYNHIIMPLANQRDKRTQIAWGIADFEHRFHRKPEGMWLAETAVDTPTLELLAASGIRFTILAPAQCAAVRPLAQAPVAEAAAEIEEESWQDRPDASVDPRHPYLVRLPSGHSITIFFYDGPLSRAIAFERLLDSGEGFAQRLAGGFRYDNTPQLVHVATDGESYGHHHRFGEMALSYALEYTEDHHLAKLTNYGEFLEKFPPRWEARIYENTSWSCAHGIERWRSNCGCNGGKPGWNQLWRTPLRQALDELRDDLAPLTREAAASIFHDYDQARDAYISVLLDHSKADAFLAAQTTDAVHRSPRRIALTLMELERHAQFMYTSCGWFFDDISGIETVQIIAYAARAIELATALFGDRATALEQQFITTLAQARSNVPEEGDGATIYRKRARSLQVNLEQVAAHYAISSVFTTYPEQARLFAYHIRRVASEVTTSGRGRLMTGEAEISSTLTESWERVVYAVLHFGDQNIAAVVKRVDPEHTSQTEEYTRFLKSTREAVTRADLPAVIRLFDREFGSQPYSIRSLFADEQRRIVRLILGGTLSEVENSLLHLYEDHAALLSFLNQTAVPRPSALSLAASFAINVMLRRALEAEPLDPAQVRSVLALVKADGISVDEAELNFIVDRRMSEAMQALLAKPRSRHALENAVTAATVARLLPFTPNIWQAQNLWYEVWRQTHPGSNRRVSDGVADESAFANLGHLLSIAPPQLTTDGSLAD